MRIALTFLILILFSSCSNNDELNGFWYGAVKTNQERFPILMKFENGNFIDYFSGDYDTIKYRYFRNTFNFKNYMNETKKYNTSLINNELSFFDSESNSLMFKVEKIKESNFVFDFLSDKSLIIDLPTGKGLEKSFRTHRFENPMYLSYKNQKLTANFLDTTMIVNNRYHEFLRDRLKSLEMDLFEWEIYRVSLIADKNIKISDLDLLKKQLKIAGYTTIDYFMKSNSYDKKNIFSLKLKELTEEEITKYDVLKDTMSLVMPSIVKSALEFKGHLMLVELNNGEIKINDKTITDKEFVDLIYKKIESEEDLVVLYHLTEGSVYRDFIHINDLYINVIYDARDKYLTNKYGFNFREEDRFKGKEINESQKEIPLIINQLTEVEYEKIKYGQ